MKLPSTQQQPTSYLIGFLLGLIMIVVFSPLITLWSLNTLFSLALPYTFATWSAVVWIKIVLIGLFSNTRKT